MNCRNLNFGSDRDLISVSQAVAVLSTFNDINQYIYIASFIPGEEKEGCRLLDRFHIQRDGCSKL